MAVWTVMAALALVVLVAVSSAAASPQRLGVLDAPQLVVRMPDGSLTGWSARASDAQEAIVSRTSTDNGVTWGEPVEILPLPDGGGVWAHVQPLLARDEEMHLFILRYGQEGVVSAGESERLLIGELVSSRIDIWYTRSRNGRSSWDPVRMIWKGYTGALNSVDQRRDGRILLPFSFLTSRTWAQRGEGLAAWTFFGQFDSTLIYSDDGGETFAGANVISVPVPDIVSAYGAVEPVVIQLRDGREWMIIRTQQGRLWQSFSADGAHWSPPEPTALISSDSPVGIVRLDDGRLVLYWNNSLRFPYAYGGRHVLHAAISADEGQTWRGFREVALDPRRLEPPPPGGDFGTAYPFPTAVNNGQVIYCTGQGQGRVLLMRLNPQWLLECRHASDLARRPEEWHIFGTRGPEFVPNPRQAGARALLIRQPEAGWPGGTTWNFPAGQSGCLRLRLLINPGSKGLLIGLTDHFSVPFDLEDRFHNNYQLEVGPDGALPGGDLLATGTWHDLVFTWDGAARQCQVTANQRQLALLPLRRETLGICYLRLRCRDNATDQAGFLIDSARVECAP